MEALESPLPPQIQEALGELVGAAREGLLALSVGVGLGVVHELMELEVDEVVGPKGKRNPDRTAKRHGHEDGSMTLGGRRVKVPRPRMRTAEDEHELPVETYEYFADRDPLTRAVMDRMLAGVSTRKFAGVGEPVGEEVEQASHLDRQDRGLGDVHRAHPHRAGELMGRRLDDVRLAVMMLDGLGDRRSHARRRARDHDRGRQDPARAVGGLDRERHARADAAGRPRRPRP